MKTSQEHVLKALSGLIPEDAQEKVSAAITSFLESAVKDIEKEYEEKLENAYEELRKDKQKDEKIAEEGYSQAWDMICEYKDRLELQNEEFKRAMDEGYEEAYQMLQEERRKNDTLETELYEEFENKLGDVKKLIVNKLDKFLQLQGEKYYEAAKRDLLNDPIFAEHKLAFERMLEAAATVLSDEDYGFANSTKVDTLVREVEELKNNVRTLEGKNMRLSMENTKLNEQVRYSESLITEGVKVDKKARVEKAKKAEGRGEAVAKKRQVVIGEQTDEPVSKGGEDRLVEHGREVLQYWNYLSGLDKSEEEESA